MNDDNDDDDDDDGFAAAALTADDDCKCVSNRAKTYILFSATVLSILNTFHNAQLFKQNNKNNEVKKKIMKIVSPLIANYP